MSNTLWLIFAVMLGAGRSIFSKGMKSDGRKGFYFNQFLLFLSGTLGIFICNTKAFLTATPTTYIYGVMFGIVTIIAQWCYTVALSRGPTSICAMIYSFGFILPTISGPIFWREPFGITSFIGIVVAVLAIIASALTDKKDNKNGMGFVLPNLIAMLASGGLGILQKIHQKSDDANNLDGFLVSAFLVATVISLFMVIASKQGAEEKITLKLSPALAGLCFGMVSFVNTMLAGRMESTILFPTLNIGVMIACMIAGIIIFKEKPTKPQILAFILGILAILVLSRR